MDSYTTYRGTARRKTPAEDHYSLPHREAADDGRIIVHVGSADEPPCPDCWERAERAVAREPTRATNRHTLTGGCGPSDHRSVYPIASETLARIMGDDDFAGDEVWIADTGFLPAELIPGRLRWAEAGYVPWHRICDRCGSHWELYPMTWGPARPSSHRATARAAELRAKSGGLVRWQDGRGEVPIDPDAHVTDAAESPTWGQFLPLLTAEMWAEAEREAPRMAGMVVVPCCWARRARIYQGRR
jgi:hypothetical protein